MRFNYLVANHMWLMAKRKNVFSNKGAYCYYGVFDMVLCLILMSASALSDQDINFYM